MGAFPDTLLDATSNGGATWTQQVALPQAGGTWAEMVFTDMAHGVLAVSGKGGPTLSATADGGARWTVLQRLPATTSVQALDFLNTQQGWMVVEVQHADAQLWSTTDGGSTWSVAPLAVPQGSLPLLAIGNSLRLDFVNAQDGWLLGGNALLQTTDGGRQWTALT